MPFCLLPDNGVGVILMEEASFFHLKLLKATGLFVSGSLNAVDISDLQDVCLGRRRATP